MLRKKILLVDDDLQIMMMIQSRLEANGYEISSASNSSEARAILKKEKIDLIVLDLIMPALAGYDLCVELKQQPETRDIPIIVLTASPKKDYHLKCLKAGAKVIVMKPFKPEELLALIKKAFDPNTRWRRPESSILD